jgi:acyl carrier protein
MSKGIEQRVFEIIFENLNIDKAKINVDSKIEDLSKDSIQLFQLIIAFEEEFKHQVQYEDLMQIITVGDIINYIKKILNK